MENTIQEHLLTIKGDPQTLRKMLDLLEENHFKPDGHIRPGMDSDPDKLEKLARFIVISEVIGGLCHDLNQPLNIVKLIAQMLIRDIKKERLDTKALSDDMEDVIAETDRMSGKLEHLRSLTRAVDKFDKESCDLNEIVKSSFNLFEQQFVNHNIKINRKISESRLDIKGIRSELEIMLMSIFTKIRRAMDESVENNKEILIHTQAVAGTDYSVNGPEVVVEIKTNIPVYQHEMGTPEHEQEIGNDLILETKVMIRMEGKIKVDNLTEQGTLFRLIFPAL